MKALKLTAILLCIAQYTKALARLDGLRAVPGKTDSEIQAINQMRQYLLLAQSAANQSR